MIRVTLSLAVLGMFLAVVPTPSAWGQAAIGIQPGITTFPSGVALNTVPVVSADRRYVRLGVNPVFTDLRSVTNFSFPIGAVAGGGVGGFGGLGGFGGGLGGQAAGLNNVGLGAGAGSGVGVVNTNLMLPSGSFFGVGGPGLGMGMGVGMGYYPAWGYGMLPYWGMPVYPTVSAVPAVPFEPFNPAAAALIPPPLTQNVTGSLIDSIQRSTGNPYSWRYGGFGWGY